MSEHQLNASLQQQIANTLGVRADIKPAQEAQRRIDFLCEHLIRNQRRSLVLGISGGVDSLCAGFLCQHAAQQARTTGHEVQFFAVRLPYGTQRDAADAERAVQLIAPDQALTINIKPASDAILRALLDGGTSFSSPAQQDFILGNIKARQRMIAQYALAGTHAGLVIGTDQAAEALMGFFTKFGDGACDVTPLSGLTKRQVRAIATYFGAEQSLVFKVPTADLEDLMPLKPDELSYGVTYDEIDDFLEGKTINDRAWQIILKQYQMTAHKRALPIGAADPQAQFAQ
ncbi:MAG: ammonia-dependent NAD(+) synthetase [Herbaspirillum sp.]